MDGTCKGCAAKVHEGPGMAAGEAQHVAGLEVAVHPPAAVQRRQPLHNQTQCLHAYMHAVMTDLRPRRSTS